MPNILGRVAWITDCEVANTQELQTQADAAVRHAQELEGKRRSRPPSLIYVTVLSGLALVALPAQGQPPTVAAVVNAASGDSTQVARGSFISIYGSNLGTQAGPPSSLPLPLTMGGATVNVKPFGGSTTYQAFLHYVSSGQINAIIPSTVPAGQADLTVTVNNVTSTAHRIQVAESSFGIFTVGSQIAGMAVVQNFESSTSLPPNSYTKPARPGQTLIMYGTGLGAYTQGSDGAAPVAGNIVNNARVLVAGTAVPAAYAGRAPGFPGVDQINFTLPDSSAISDGCSIPVQLQVGSLSAQGFATIAKTSDGAVCRHPFALSQDQLTALQTGKTFKSSIVQILKFHLISAILNGSGIGSTAEQIQVGVTKFAANGSPTTNQGYPFALSQTPGTCSVIKAAGTDLAFIDHIDITTLLTTTLDAGSTFSLSGPAGTMNVDSSGGITHLSQGSDLPGVPSGTSFLQDGNYTLAFPGGRDVAAAQAKFTLQNQFKANFPASISKGKALTLTWSGGNPGDLTRIFMTSPTLSGVSPLITCTANATDHTFTVSGDLTGQLVGDVPIGILGFYAIGAPIPFTAPLTAGGTLDSGNIVTGTIEYTQSIPVQ